MTVTGRTLGENLDWWENAPRRHRFRKELQKLDGVDPDDVIMDADRARAKGLTSTTCFPVGNISPEGAVVQKPRPSTLLCSTRRGVYRHTGPAKVFTTERDTIAAIKDGKIEQGDVLVMISCGPMGTGMGGSRAGYDCAQIHGYRQARGPAYGRAVFGVFPLVLALGTSARRPWLADRLASCGTAT